MTDRLASGDVGAATLSVGGAAALIQQLTGHRPGHSTLWRWVRSGRLPATRIGAKYIVREHAVHELLARDAELGAHAVDAAGLARTRASRAAALRSEEEGAR